ncbi:PDZ domain-containing protein [Acidithiobacillus montserratensis]|uniref:PDZ domain-containing protein n=1 Tax=Acidithiobacillus montserratensis TaxID=2729135 RepID=A0ACD5HEE3_9PROT|nr:PDZ domain-containing protein [Acidithiobacillus montserratensis]MBN2678780.1 M61 family metallopeptidase [Acidithiobacillaceae bacterium]MBU2749024.1 M61 family metallopeptidase [Acidithiobacillus montserratensis]
MQSPIRYTVVMEPNAHLFQVVLDIAEPDPDGQVLALPAWVPGSYTIRDLARHITEITAESLGEAVSLRKIATDRWISAAISGALRITYRVYALDQSVRTAFLDHLGGFFNGPALFLRVLGQEERGHTLSISGPEQWQLGTSMPRVSGETWGWGDFQAENYRAFIDHPMLMGTLTLLNFEAGGLPHHLLIQGSHDADLQALGRDMARICTWQQNFWGESPFQEYHFLCKARSDDYGGLEHRASSALVCARDDLNGRDPNNYRRFLGLVSHEYFHSWLVQAIRPGVFSASALDKAELSRDLWVFEGITSYYDDLCLRRAGLLSAEQYLQGLAKEWTRLQRRPGQFLQSVAESSEDAWLKLYHPHVNSANFEISYYNKGALLALCLDLSLRLDSAGKLSLDNLLARFWKDYGQTKQPLPEGAALSLIADLAGGDMARQVQSWLEARAELPLAALLARMGIALQQRPASSLSDAGGEDARTLPSAWIGAHWKSHALGVQLRQILSGSPAEQAGLSPDDIIIALEGQRATAEKFAEKIASSIPGCPLQLQYFRDDVLYSTQITPVTPVQDTYWLECLEDVDAVVRARRDAWLSPA